MIIPHYSNSLRHGNSIHSQWTNEFLFFSIRGSQIMHSYWLCILWAMEWLFISYDYIISNVFLFRYYSYIYIYIILIIILYYIRMDNLYDFYSIILYSINIYIYILAILFLSLYIHYISIRMGWFSE